MTLNQSPADGEDSLAHLEQLLLTCRSATLEFTCHAMRRIQCRFLHPYSEFKTLAEYVDAKHKELKLSFTGSSGALYALGASVFDDLRDFLAKPTSLSQVRALTKLPPNGRVVVWGRALQLLDGGVHTQITRSTLEAISAQLNVATRRTPPAPPPCVAMAPPHEPLPATMTAACEGSALSVFMMAQTDRWGTPTYIVKTARKVLGGCISLDPFSEKAFNKTVKAKRIFTRKDNGFRQDWWGHVFLNAPGGMVGGESAMGLALRKAITEYRSGRVLACLCLLKAAVGYKWFEDVYRYPVCFLRDRPKFHQPSGDVVNESPHGYAMVYLGRKNDSFLTEFSRLGQVYLPV